MGLGLGPAWVWDLSAVHLFLPKQIERCHNNKKKEKGEEEEARLTKFWRKNNLTPVTYVL